MANDHDHTPHEIAEHDVPGHPEHGGYWPPRSIARTRAAIAITELVENGTGRSPAAKAVVDRLRGTLRHVGEIDEFVQLARQALFGDLEALASARKWLGTSRDGEGHGADRRGYDGAHHRAALGDLQAEPWIHPSGLLDFAIGAAFVAPDGDRRAALQTVRQRVFDVARSTAVTMAILADIPRELPGGDRFDLFLDRLDGFGGFDDLPLDLGGCLGEVLEVLGRPNGAFTQASQASEMEVDDNTDRIASITPDPVCTGARLTLTSRTGQPFVQRSDVTVAFTPCGLLGSDITWTPGTVTVTVPAGAKTGPVYFARHNAAVGAQLAGTAAIEMAGALGNCPFLGGASTSSIMIGAMREPLGNMRCFIPLGMGRPVEVRQAAAITAFKAVAQNGSPITAQSLPGPDDPIKLEWQVTAEQATSGSPTNVPPTNVRLLVDGAQLAQGLGLKDTYAILKAQSTKTYTLEVMSGCGTIAGDLTIPVLRVLRFNPPDVSILPGQTATLSLTIDRPFATATTIFLTTNPSHSTAPGWATIPAGQTQVQIPYAGVQAGPPRTAALTVIAYAARCSPATGRMWVASPLGTHEIVANRSGGPSFAAIDVVGVHAALTTAGSVLLFAYDESPSGYSNINTGKSAVWDPRTNQVQSIPMSRNLFCAGHAFLGDGRVMVAGGQSTAITVTGTLGSLLGGGYGADHDVHIFGGGAWTRIMPDMPGARWYPTCATLPDGRVLIVSGYAAHAYAMINGDYEILDGTTNSLVKRTGFKTLIPYNHELDVYPFLQVLPGRNLFVHSHETTWLLPLDASNEPVIGSLGFTPFYNGVSPNSRTYPGEGACVMLPLDPAAPTKARILVIGGGGGPHGSINAATAASNSAEIFDFDSTVALDTQPQWRFTKDSGGNQTFLTNPRLMGDAVLLPDGTVAIIGGAGGGEADDAGPPIMWVEEFDPATETFTSRTGISVPRLYHSTALLLPNGSVMIAGSTGARWDQSISGGSSNEFRIEVYHPPYLFRGPRPALTLPSTMLQYGQSVSIGIPTGGQAITRALIIRHGSTTHTNNMDQRCIGLRITGKSNTQITVAMPPDGSAAPPGPYMVFVVSNDASGAPVPSVAALAMLGP